MSQSIYEKKLQTIVKGNLKKIYDAGYFVQSDLAKIFSEQGFSIQQATISKYIDPLNNSRVPLAFLVKFSEHFGIPLTELTVEEQTMSFAQYIERNNFNRLLPVIDFSELTASFIIDPDNSAFTNYSNHYHGYFLSTESQSDRLLFSTLSLESNTSGRYYKAELILKDKKKNYSITKNYSGLMVISGSKQYAYIILADKKASEINILCFNHLNLRTTIRHCILAEALTVSAGNHHYPTVHRFFLSSEPIKCEDYNLIKTELKMNSKKFFIFKEDLIALSKETIEFEKVLKELYWPIVKSS